MLKKISVISLAVFILSGNLKSFSMFQNLPMDILILTMILPVAYFVIFTFRNMSLHKSFFLLIMFFLSLIPVLFYLDSQTEKTITFLLMIFILAFISPTLLNTETSIVLFIKTLLFVSLFICASSLIGSQNLNSEGRLTLDGGNPIWLSRAVSFAALVLVIRYIEKKIKLWKFFLLFLPVIYTMFSTGSKGPIVALLIALFITYFDYIRMAFTNKRMLIGTMILIYTLIPASIFIYFSSYNLSFNRLFDFTSYKATTGRVLLYQDATDIIKNHPLGIGIGNFEKYSFFTYPHNLILEAFAELGWFSGIFFTLLLLGGFIGLRYLSKHSNQHYKYLLAIFIMSAVNSMVSGDLTSPKEMYILLPLGLNPFIYLILSKKKMIGNNVLI